MRIQKKRIAVLLMVGTMLFCNLPIHALATENPNTGELCQHHPEHTVECGYTAGEEGTPCDHEHTESCYTLLTECVHKHGPECYPQEGVSNNMASPSDAGLEEPSVCTHVCSEESGCITRELNCPHEHNGECSYIPATEEVPCAFVCEECN